MSNGNAQVTEKLSEEQTNLDLSPCCTGCEGCGVDPYAEMKALQAKHQVAADARVLLAKTIKERTESWLFGGSRTMQIEDAQQRTDEQWRADVEYLLGLANTGLGL